MENMVGTTMYEEHHRRGLNLRTPHVSLEGEQKHSFLTPSSWCFMAVPIFHPFCVRLGFFFCRGLQEGGEMPRVQSRGQLRHRQLHGHMVSDHGPFTNILATEIVPRDCTSSPNERMRFCLDRQGESRNWSTVVSFFPDMLLHVSECLYLHRVSPASVSGESPPFSPGCACMRLRRFPLHFREDHVKCVHAEVGVRRSQNHTTAGLLLVSAHAYLVFPFPVVWRRPPCLVSSIHPCPPRGLSDLPFASTDSVCLLCTLSLSLSPLLPHAPRSKLALAGSNQAPQYAVNVADVA